MNALVTKVRDIINTNETIRLKRPLGESFAEARRFGRVHIFSHSDNTYAASIEFDTIKHTTLKASSDHQHKSPEEAVEQAILNAKKIVDTIRQLA